jgi:hypothetical protein
MFSKLSTRAVQAQPLSALSTMAFRTTTVTNASKKPSIGDAVTILQSKVSQINQVVSRIFVLPRKCPFPLIIRPLMLTPVE